MESDLLRLIKEALEVPCTGFVETVEKTTELLENENGRIGNLEIIGRLVKIKPKGHAVVIGDLHGDIESLNQILQESQALERMKSDDTIIIFLGDYGDRGQYSAEVYYTVLKLKLRYPRQIVLMRGNHEQFSNRNGNEVTPSPHELPFQFQKRFGRDCGEAYTSVRRLFQQLHIASLVRGRFLFVHGGLPSHISKIEDLAFADGPDAPPNLLEEIVWSDPDEHVEYVTESPRGAGMRFGRKVTIAALTKIGVRILVRGHEPCPNGFKINHDSRVLTLFSRKGSPYYNTYGSYLDVDLAGEFQNAEELIPYIHKF